MASKPYPSDVKDDEWEFVAPYLALIRENSPQREHDLREIYNALRWVVRAGAPWRMIPNDLPPWAAVYQQVQRWIKAGGLEEMVHDLREILRIAAGREANADGQVGKFMIARKSNERRSAAIRLLYRIQFLRQVEVGIHAASPRRMRRCAAGVR